MLDFNKIQKIHFIGIGGIGMSALARIFLNQGKTISGSDKEDSSLIQELKSEGISIEIGHKEFNLTNSTELVIISEAIPEGNSELKKAKILAIPVMSYFQALGELSKNYECIAVCGAHGKTTTTALMALVLMDAGLDPTVVVGTKVKEFGWKNVRMGKGKYLVVEACEYRRSFLSLDPKMIIITNIEPDHLDYYKDADDYRLAFEQFVRKLPTGEGKLIVYAEDEQIQKLLQKNYNVKVIKYGSDAANDYFLERSEIQTRQGKIGEFNLQIPGRHNLLNALAVLSAGKELGLEDQKIIESINKFEGTWRRFEFKGNKNGVDVYDDYAHHPTEIKATLMAAREKFKGRRIVLVYQPHQYNRTIKLFNDFAKAFNDADMVIVPNIYKVRDTRADVKAMSPEILVAEIQKNNPKAVFGNGFRNTQKILKNELKEGDVLMTMGAGDVWKIADNFLKLFKI